MGNNEEALKDYSQAIKINPKNAVYYARRGALTSRTGGDLKQAAEDMTVSIKLADDDFEKYLTRGIIFYKLGEYLLAIDDFNIVLKKDPENKPAKEFRHYSIQYLNKAQ